MGVMTTKFLGKFGEIVFILRNAFIYRGLRNFLGDCYTLSPNKEMNIQISDCAFLRYMGPTFYVILLKNAEFTIQIFFAEHLVVVTSALVIEACLCVENLLI